MKMTEVRMSMEEYLRLINGLSFETVMETPPATPTPKPKRRSSAYQKRYKANFKKVAKRFKTKSGKWKKNGFKAAVKMAHRMSKK